MHQTKSRTPMPGDVVHWSRAPEYVMFATTAKVYVSYHPQAGEPDAWILRWLLAWSEEEQAWLPLWRFRRKK